MVDCAGLENWTHSVESTGGTSTSDGGGGNLPVSLPVALKEHPDLIILILAWAKLPEPVRAGIMAMVRAAAPDAADCG